MNKGHLNPYLKKKLFQYISTYKKHQLQEMTTRHSTRYMQGYQGNQGNHRKLVTFWWGTGVGNLVGKW